MSNDMITKELLEDLADGKTVEYGDYLLRVSEQPDYNTELNDFDCYGKVVPAVSHRYRANVSDRPEDFDGMAEIVWTYSDRFWWQPPNWDKETRRYWHTHPEYRSALREAVRNILDFGFVCYVLEVCDKKTDAYGKNIVLSYSSIGGCEPLMNDSDKVSVISDLVYEATFGLTHSHEVR